MTIDQPAFMVAVVPDLTGGRLSSHDKDLLGLARRVADADAEQPGAVVAILFGEHKEEALGEAGIDRVVHLDERALRWVCSRGTAGSVKCRRT